MSTPVYKDWYAALTHALKKEGENGGVLQLATLEGSDTPRVRSVVHREFLTANAFPNVPLIVSTTDIRTPKVFQMMNIGQRVEAVYWTASTQEQYRITGKASVIPRPGCQSPCPSGSGLIFDELAKEGFDWENKRVEVFDRMSGHLKASWCRPIPGTPLEGGYEEANKWPEKLPKLGGAESEEDKKNLEYALENFALLLIEPFEVDFVELGTTPQKRTKFRRDSGAVEFKKTILVP
ncbi:pyridoxamine 5'-phosphate oxidase-domain-containing protein [Phlebopus sp. FC_14]|nr:pyridoxamine 5'-phosphate oxidase-domain-containing protein [Phlebopus sp. FC_14]